MLQFHLEHAAPSKTLLRHLQELDIRRTGYHLLSQIIGFRPEMLPYFDIHRSYQTDESTLYTTNVSEVITHGNWPQIISDRQAEAAQYMVGYFTGHPTLVRKAQTRMEDGLFGRIDPSVTVRSGPWTPPTEQSDDCVFCQRLTDESVRERVAGFQWAIDKEVARQFGAGEVQAGEERPPKHFELGDDYAGRRAYHNQLRMWIKNHPALLKPIVLIDLPFELQRTLCIQWNHIIRDYIEGDARFIYRAEDNSYWRMFVKRASEMKNLVPLYTPTRSLPDNATDEGQTGSTPGMEPFFGFYSGILVDD